MFLYRKRVLEASVRSENWFVVIHPAHCTSVVRFTACQVTTNTKWPAVQISSLKRIKGKYNASFNDKK